MTPNEAAFLAMLRHSEGTDRVPDPYRCVFGFTLTIQDLSDHPYITGEWQGGQYGGHLDTAAGAYQIIVGTWRTCKAILHLPDFTAPSQDAAALELIREAGALPLINSGLIGQAIQNCGHIWASLPSSDAGQPQKTTADLLSAYTAAGGEFA